MSSELSDSAFVRDTGGGSTHPYSLAVANVSVAASVYIMQGAPKI